MDRAHALLHLRELRSRVALLRPMRADGPSYKLWLGDVVEFANTVWGAGSDEVSRIAAVLREELAGAGEMSERRYLRRLERLDGVLAEIEGEFGTEGPARERE